ncbi:metallophosphoesterase family protein [Desulforhopalus singaporensis]|uniref:Predicted phosphoesterase n=1 Tax=Desulforhopalus singaporensis TaxID=91360 RepID=A0A1H0KQ67_9BACT|nr:metallophosphoesterase [Desulforhopalus singaporensis]SDO58124.1 Predicted phosphoesterase [Desulforhopalus singaporensis]
MKILTVADTECGELLDPVKGGPPLAGIDLILGCGDLAPEYLTTLRNRFEVPLYYVLGNHDLRHHHSPPQYCTPIHRRIVNFNNLGIIGFSGSRWYNGSANQYTEKQMAGYIGKMRFGIWKNRGIDIVIAHAPPRFINDAEDPCHRGFRSYRRLIDKYRPSYFLHGHIHTLFDDDNQRITTINNTSVINCYGFYVLEI